MFKRLRMSLASATISVRPLIYILQLFSEGDRLNCMRLWRNNQLKRHGNATDKIVPEFK
jgi:hypothetical protein